MPSMDPTLRRHTDYRFVTISNVDMANMVISAYDQYKQLIKMTLTIFDPLVAVPAPGEKWLARSQNHAWFLVSRAETGNEDISVKSLNPGDRRLEGNDIYINGEHIYLNGKDLQSLIDTLQAQITTLVAQVEALS